MKKKKAKYNHLFNIVHSTNYQTYQKIKKKI